MDEIDFSVELQRIIENLTNKHNQEIKALAELHSQRVTLNKDDILMLKVDIGKISPISIMEYIKSLESMIKNTVVAIVTDYEALPKEDVIMQLEGIISRLKGDNICNI